MVKIQLFLWFNAQLFLMMRKIKSLIINRNKSFLIGITSGIILSLMIMPFLEDCNFKSTKLGWYEHVVNNDYNPVVTVDHKPKVTYQNQKSQMKKLLRPKFYKTELNVKDNLLLGILLTNEKHVLTLGSVVNKTLSNFADKIIYFVDSSSSNKHMNNQLFVSSIVYLSDYNQMTNSVSNSNSRYLKILNYIFAKNLVNNYNFIFLITDQTYVKGDQLEKFVSTFSMSENVFATANIAQNAQQHFYLNFNHDKDDVILEAGVLFSCTLLLKCNFNEICLKKYQNQFSWPNQFTFHSYRITSQLSTNDLSNIEIQSFIKSLTTYQIHTVDLHYKLDLLWNEYLLNRTIKELKQLEDEIVQMDKFDDKISWPIGIPSENKPLNRFDVIRWSYFNETHSFMPNDFDVILPLNHVQKREINDIKSKCIEWINNKYGNGQKLKIVNFYRKFDATRGLEYIVDVSLPEMKRLELIKPLNKIELVPDVPYVTENSKIIMLLPIRIKEEIESASSFLNQYENLFLKNHNHQTVLLLLLIYQPSDQGDVYGHIKVEAGQLQNKYKFSSAKIAWISITSANENQIPSELAYIDIVMRKISFSFDANLLFLHCRVNMLLSFDFLNRVRLNTINGYQVFFPIPFVEYRIRSQVKPLKNFDVRKDNGYFDQTNYNYASFYLRDYKKARKAIHDKIPLVKFEHELNNDVYYNSNYDLFELFSSYNSNAEKKLFMMRAIEPELKIKQEDFSYNCSLYESNKFSLDNCLLRNVIGLGTKQQLALLITDDEHREQDEDN